MPEVPHLLETGQGHRLERVQAVLEIAYSGGGIVQEIQSFQLPSIHVDLDLSLLEELEVLEILCLVGPFVRPVNLRSLAKSQHDRF